MEQRIRTVSGRFVDDKVSGLLFSSSKLARIDPSGVEPSEMSGLSWPVPELRVAEVDRRLRFSAASADESDNKTLMTVTDWDDEQRSAFRSGTAILIDSESADEDASDPHGRGNLPREGALPLAGSLLSVPWPPRRRHSWICRYRLMSASILLSQRRFT